ncbi:6208_t:CDS:2, partial [Dentiscutata erythropus]
MEPTLTDSSDTINNPRYQRGFSDTLRTAVSKPSNNNEELVVNMSSTIETVNEHMPLFLNDIDDYDSNDEPDPFLLLSVKRPPPRPKYIISLFLIAVSDLIIIFACTIASIHIDNLVQWDLLGFGILRVSVALVVASSEIRGLGWVLGCSCALSSLYILFKCNFIFQYKTPIQSYYLCLLASSFIFSQLHWIAYIIVTSDSRRQSLLRNSYAHFEEEQRNIVYKNFGSPLNTFRNSSTSRNSRNYGSIFSNDIDPFVDDGGVTNSAIESIASRQGYNTIKISKTDRNLSFSASLPIPIASSAASSVRSSRSSKRYKKKMRIQNVPPLKKHNNNDIPEEASASESFNHQLSDAKTKKIDSVHSMCNEDDSLLDRQSVYFQPPHEDILEYSSGNDNPENDLDDSISVDVSNDVSNDISNDASNITFANKLPTNNRAHYKKLVKYPSEMGSSHDDVILDRYADAEIIGSAPVGNGKWSTLKRKKVDIESYHSKDFASDEFDTVSKNLPLDTHNFNDNENMLNIEQKNDSFKFDAMAPHSISVPVMSPRTSLLTMAFNAESSIAQATKTDPYLHVSTDNSSLTRSNDENISLSESSETDLKSPLSKTFESNSPQTNRNSFIPKFSSPLAIRAPIIASTDDHYVNQNTKQDDNVGEFTNVNPAQNIRDEQKVNNSIQTVYNQKTSSEITDSLLPPIEEELSKSHQNSLRSTIKKTVPDSSVHVKPTHLRESSNSLQKLFVNTAVGLNSENISEDSDQKNDNYTQNDINKRKTILSEKFSLAIKKGWNNEFVEAEEILMRRRDGIPRWCVAFAEVQLVKHLMTGQAVEYQDPELINSLMEAEKLASKVCENKDDFETTFALFITDVWKTDIKPISTPNEDEAEFASLRANYRWDCELAMADILLFRSVLQVISGSEIKGALNLRRAWKLYSKVKDEIDRIKGESNKNGHKNEPSSANSNNSNRWSLMAISSVVRLGGHTQEGSGGVHDAINSIKVDPDIEDCL